MAQVLDRLETVEAKRRPRTIEVEVFATNLHAPSHMEWTLDGRLLVSEHTAGQMKDVTRGGDMRDVKPFASGLQGPASILPLEDGRILVSETWAGRVTDISSGGDISRKKPFASDLIMPYTFAHWRSKGGRERITVSESFGPFNAQNTDITRGGGRADFEPYVQDMPSIPGAPGLTPLFAWPDNWEMFAAAECVKNWTGVYDDSLIVAVGPLGQILKVPDEGGKYSHLVERGCLIAWGLQRMGGMKAHPTDGRIYAVQPECGSVIAIDPSTPQNYRFEPPVVQGLNTPTCPRFSPDGETMFVCGSGNGVIWKVTNFLR